MPNDFSTDPRCKALWRFENDLLDSKGGNHLTGSGVSFVSDNKMEGDYAADFEQSEGDYAYRSDADLDAGFPFKSGDTNKKITVCFWQKQESYMYPGYVFAKYDTNNRRSFAVARYGSNIRVYSGYNNGASYEYFETNQLMYNGEWYHVGIAFDGLNKNGIVRLYRASNESTYSWSFEFENETYVCDANLTVGARHDASSSYLFDGLLDELVVFNDLLSIEEIDAIRNGTFTGPLPGHVRANSLGALVAYSLTPDIGYVRGDALGALVAYGTSRPPKRVFPAIKSKTRWQSRANRRKFPLVS